MTIVQYTATCTSCHEVATVRAHSGSPIKLVCPCCKRTLVENVVYRGFVYIFSNETMQGIVKIGLTERDVYQRAGELNGATGVPTKFHVEAFFISQNPAADETAIHSQLKEFRVSNNREFFRLQPIEAIERLTAILRRRPIVINDGTNPQFDLYFDDSLPATPIRFFIHQQAAQSSMRCLQSRFHAICAFRSFVCNMPALWRLLFREVGRISIR
jgi:hypothetical protein